MKAKSTLTFTKEQAIEVFREFLRSKGYEVENVYFRIDDTGHEIMGFYKDLVRVECEVSQDI